jgi:ABC-type Fe3+/spermidine/putrescine transport system ATPase subunit/nucleotide-binding universal stress UspA family protein
MSIVLDRLTKRFGSQLVVDQVSLEIAEGELFVLLGSSGSGKTSILRMIAGLTIPDSGRIILHGKDVTRLAPQQRGAGFVFQNYSLFRHMTVAENIEFGLTVRKASPAERSQRRDTLLDLVGLTGFGRRYPHELSGGQQQRVALARALAYEPNVLLLDEPFGALDVKIRTQLRRSLKDIQRQLGVTAVLVTHDQEEAFELADQIAVIERGRVLEVGSAESLYAKPSTLFVSTFLGAGTVLVGRAEGDRAHFGTLSLPIPAEVPHDEGARVELLFRPEQVALSQSRPSDNEAIVGQGKIVEHSFTGMLRRVRLRLPRLAGTRQLAPQVPFGEEGLLVDAILPAGVPFNDGELWVTLRGWHILQQPLSLLVCDRGGQSIAPLGVARALASRLNASVTLLGVAGGDASAETMRATLAERQQQSGLVEAQVRVRSGNPADRILAEQNSVPHDFILLAAKPQPDSARPPRLDRHGLTRRPGGTLASVLEGAHLPVLVIKGDRSDFSRVLICTAAGEPGKRDVALGGRLARRLGASVTLLYITRAGAEPNQLARAHLELAVATLRALEVTAEVLVCSAASPSAGILEQAHLGDYDLVVLGSHGPRSRLLFGASDITMGVIAAIDRHVLVVPPEAS